MRKILFVAVLALLATPVLANDSDGKDEHRRVKVNFQTGWGDSPLIVHQDPAALALDFNTGKSFDQAFWFRFVGEYLMAKPGAVAGGMAMGNRSTVDAFVWTSSPSAYQVGDVFPLYQQRYANGFTSGVPLSLEVRPRIGGRDSRWRLGIGVAQSRRIRVAGVATSDQAEVDAITVIPWDRNVVMSWLELSRRYYSQTFDSEITLYTVNLGPEFDLVRSRFVDLSVEGGIMGLIYARNDYRTEKDYRYDLFSPEHFAPDADPSQLRTLTAERAGSKDHMSGGRSYGEVQFYLGARAEFYPVHWAGIGVNTRWHVRNPPLTNTYYPMFGSYDVTYESHPWTTNFYVVLAVTKHR